MIEVTDLGFYIISGDECIGTWVKQTGRLDCDGLLPTIVKHIRPNSSVIDVGANIGDHTWAYLRACAPGKAFAFEPNPEAFDCLVKNCPEAICFPKAVSDRFGRKILNVPRIDPRTATFLPVHRSITDSFSVSVATTTLDYEFPDLADCSLIKIDTEGHEYQVIAGAKSLIKRSRPVLAIEMNGFPDERALTGPSLSELIQSIGYYAAFSPGQDWNTPSADIFCLPQ